jgi:hypothetical protein
MVGPPFQCVLCVGLGLGLGLAGPLDFFPWLPCGAANR